MNGIEDFYFDWLLRQLHPEGVREGVVYVSSLLHNCTFRRDVGLDRNRRNDGKNLRGEFLSEEEGDFDQDEIDDLRAQDCTWFEMLVALARRLDYLYDGSVQGRYFELLDNMGIEPLSRFNPNRSRRLETFDQGFVNVITSKIDDNRFDRMGHGGLFPLMEDHGHDQRELEIWKQHHEYFIERLEGVLGWTSTS